MADLPVGKDMTRAHGFLIVTPMLSLSSPNDLINGCLEGSRMWRVRFTLMSLLSAKH